jgi:predicted metal-dependent enzyme (double-stranded beta helix superfamily)
LGDAKNAGEDDIGFVGNVASKESDVICESSAAAEPGGLEVLAELAKEPTLKKAVPLLARLTNDDVFLRRRIFPLLLRDVEGTDGWYVAHRSEGGEGSCSLEVFVWPPGTRTQIHDHASWGVFRCVVGTILEERYDRLDDGSRFEHAHLKEAWRVTWGRAGGASTVLPGDDGIHRVGNPGGVIAISVHLYGPRFGEVDGRDYDPSRDYVCDRCPA